MRKFITGIAMGLLAWSALFSPVAAETFINDEFGLKVEFPTGLKVCVALSGDHPHGFYAWINKPTDCSATKVDAKLSAISVYAGYNANFETSPWQELDVSCKGSPNTILAKREFVGLSFKGLASVACVRKAPGGAIGIDVVALAGKWRDAGSDPDLQAPYVMYHAYLGTRPERVSSDLIKFKAFLVNAVIEPPS